MNTLPKLTDQFTKLAPDLSVALGTDVAVVVKMMQNQYLAIHSRIEDRWPNEPAVVGSSEKTKPKAIEDFPIKEETRTIEEIDAAIAKLNKKRKALL